MTHTCNKNLIGDRLFILWWIDTLEPRQIMMFLWVGEHRKYPQEKKVCESWRRLCEGEDVKPAVYLNHASKFGTLWLSPRISVSVSLKLSVEKFSRREIATPAGQKPDACFWRMRKQVWKSTFGCWSRVEQNTALQFHLQV